jgi:hypothetical protein
MLWFCPLYLQVVDRDVSQRALLVGNDKGTLTLVRYPCTVTGALR